MFEPLGRTGRELAAFQDTAHQLQITYLGGGHTFTRSAGDPEFFRETGASETAKQCQTWRQAQRARTVEAGLRKGSQR